MRTRHHHAILIMVLCIAMHQGPVFSTTENDFCQVEATVKDLGLFSAFFPVGLVDDRCRKLSSTIECIDANNGKFPSRTLTRKFDGQKLQMNFICQNKQEYKESQACFSGEGLQTLLDFRCLRKTNVFDCGACAKVSKCVGDLVKSRKGCMARDAELMVTVAILFFYPIRESKRCNDKPPGPDNQNYCSVPTNGEPTTKTTTRVTATTTAPATTMETSTTFSMMTSSQLLTNRMSGNSSDSPTNSDASSSTNHAPASWKASARVDTDDDDGGGSGGGGGCNRIFTVNTRTLLGLALCSVLLGFSLV